MPFHATAAAVSARPNRISTLRNHLLCSVCTAMLLVGSGGMALAETPAPATGAPAPVAQTAPVEAGSPPPAASVAPEVAPAASSKTDTPATPAQSTASPAPTTPPAGNNKTVDGAFTLEADETLDDIILNGLATIHGQIQNATVSNPFDGAVKGLAGVLVLDGDKAKATGTIVVGPNDGSELLVQSGAAANKVIVNGTKAKTTDQERSGGLARVVGEKSRIETVTVNNGGQLDIEQDGTAGTITVNKDGALGVEAGGTAENVTLDGGYASTAGKIDTTSITGKDSKLEVEAGGTAGTVTVNKDGELSVLKDGKADTVNVNGGGYASTAGKIVKATIDKDGRLRVLTGGVAETVTVKDGVLTVLGGGKADTVNVNDGGYASTMGGEIGTATITGKDSSLDVWASGTAGTVTVNNGGKLQVNVGKVDDVTVNGEKAWGKYPFGPYSGGFSLVEGDGVGGIAQVSDEGSSIGKGTVNLGGLLTVNKKASAGNITVNNGGKLDVKSGGTVENITVQGEKAVSYGTGGSSDLSIGGFAEFSDEGSLLMKGTVNLGGLLIVSNKASADSVAVNSGGRLEVKDGGVIKDLSVHAQGTASVACGSTCETGNRIDRATIDKDGSLVVARGEVGNVIVDAGGRLEVGYPGTVDNVSLNGGVAAGFGVFGKTVIGTGGTLTLRENGRAKNVTVNNGGKLEVKDGGNAKDVTVYGVTAWNSDGTGGIGGTATVSGSTGKIEKSTVYLGGLLSVSDKATAGAVTVENGGKLEVKDGGNAEDVTVNGVTPWGKDGTGGVGGIAQISGERSLIKKSAVNLGGLLMVDDKASAGTVTVNNGGKLDVKAGGKADDVTVKDHGTAYTSGEIVRAAVDSSGALTVQAGGRAGDVTVRGNTGDGGLLVSAGGTVTDLTSINGFAKISGEITGRSTFYGGVFVVNAGGKMADVSMNGGGYAKTYGKIGTATITGKDSWLDVYTGGTVDTVSVEGGKALIYGQIGTATITGKDSWLDVDADGEITGKSTVGNGGHLTVVAGGAVGDVALTGDDSSSPTSYAVIDGTAGDVALSGNAGLSGAGTVGNLVVHAGGKVFPGSDVEGRLFSPLTATGNVTFDKGSFFAVQIANDGVRSGKLAVQGQATLDGGTVEVRAEDLDTKTNKFEKLSQQQVNNLFQKSFVILTAEKGVTGRFEKVEPNYNYITPSLAYTDKAVSVGFDLTAAAKAEQQKAEAMATEERVKNLVLVDAATPNQKSVGRAVMQLGLGNRLLQSVLFSKKGQVLAYDTLSGEAHATLRGTLLQDAGLVSAAASDRVRAAFDGVAARPVPVMTPLAYGPEARDRQSADQAFAAAAPAVSTTALWGQAYGGWSHGSSDGNAAAYNRNTGGFVTGMDGLIAGTWRLGVLAGYGATALDGAGSSISADSYQVGVYGGTAIDALRLSLGAVLAHHEIDSRRKVSFGSLAETENAGYSANSVHIFGEAAYRIDTPYAAFEPFAAAAYTHLKTDGFTETGGIAALSAPSATTDLTTTTLGLRASRDFTLGEATRVTARGMAGWRHAYGDVTPEAQFAFASGGDHFGITGQAVAPDTALVEAGLTFGIGKAATIGLTYTGQFSADVSDNAVKADLAVRF